MANVNGLVKALVDRPQPIPMQSVLEDRGSKIYAAPDFKTFFSAFRVPIGIEVEVEGFAVEKWPKCIYWVVDKDGSLKDHGHELISVPVAGKNIDYALKELVEAMKVQQPRWSHRCSVHVHINIRQWTIQQARALVMAYAVFENLFFSLVPEDRRAGGFAYPITDTIPGEFQFGYQDGKYSAMNIGSSIAKFGTVEFRHMYGTADPIILRRWIQLIVKLHAYVKKAGTEKVIEAVLGLNTTSEYQKFLWEVFGQTANVFPPTVLQKSMEDGVLWAKLYYFGGK
jgi:hypothetical protein